MRNFVTSSLFIISLVFSLFFFLGLEVWGVSHRTRPRCALGVPQHLAVLCPPLPFLWLFLISSNKIIYIYIFFSFVSSRTVLLAPKFLGFVLSTLSSLLKDCSSPYIISKNCYISLGRGRVPPEPQAPQSLSYCSTLTTGKR